MKNRKIIITLITIFAFMVILSVSSLANSRGYCAVGEVSGNKAAILTENGSVLAVEYVGLIPTEDTVYSYTEINGTFRFAQVNPNPVWIGGQRICSAAAGAYYQDGANTTYFYGNSPAFLKLGNNSWKVATTNQVIINEGEWDFPNTAYPANMPAYYNESTGKIEVMFADATVTYESGLDVAVCVCRNETAVSVKLSATCGYCAVGQVDTTNNKAAILNEIGQVLVVTYTGTAPTEDTVNAYSEANGVYTFTPAVMNGFSSWQITSYNHPYYPLIFTSDWSTIIHLDYVPAFLRTDINVWRVARENQVAKDSYPANIDGNWTSNGVGVLYADGLSYYAQGENPVDSLCVGSADFQLKITDTPDIHYGYCVVGQLKGDKAAILTSEGVKVVTYANDAPTEDTFCYYWELGGVYTFYTQPDTALVDYNGYNVFPTYFLGFDEQSNSLYAYFEGAIAYLKLGDFKWKMTTGVPVQTDSWIYPSKLYGVYNGDFDFVSYLIGDATGDRDPSAYFCTLADTFDVKIPAPELDSASVTLGTDLALNIFVQAASSDGLSVKVTRNDTTTVVPYVKTVDGLFVYTYEGINPQCMTDKFTIELYNGEQLIDTVTDYTVKGYLSELKSEFSSDELLCALVDTTLNFGTASQLYVGYNTNDLASEHTTFDIEYAFNNVKTRTGGTEIKSASLVLGSHIYIRFVYESEATPVLRCGGAGLEYTVENLGNGRYAVLTPAISAFAVGDVYELTVGNCTCSYTASQYIQSKINDTSVCSTDGLTLGDFLAALYSYAAASHNFICR